MKITNHRGTSPVTPAAPVGDRPARPEWTQRVVSDVVKPKTKPAPQRDEFVATGKPPLPQEPLTYDRSMWQAKPGIARDKENAGNGSGLGDGNAASHPTVSTYGADGELVRRNFGRER